MSRAVQKNHFAVHFNVDVFVSLDFLLLPSVACVKFHRAVPAFQFLL